jgi:serine/threonine-protein kinase
MPQRIVGRYAVFQPIGAGGMAAVHLARHLDDTGTPRVVAVKRMHSHGGEEPAFVNVLIDEARLSGRVHHPNVVPTLDVVVEEGEVLLVMEYAVGESLYRLVSESVTRSEQVPVPIAARIAVDILRGLHGAHEATDEQGQSLNLVHRDVSPQNVIVGVNGLARLLDFGVAKARGRLQSTHDGQLKGKLAYMSPEQVQGNVSQRSDVFSAAVVLWEALTGRRLFDAVNEGAILNLLLNARLSPPSNLRPEVPPALDAVVMRGLARDPDDRFGSAAEMAYALANACELAPRDQVAQWVQRLASERLEQRARQAALVASVPRETLQVAEGLPRNALPSLTDGARLSSPTTTRSHMVLTPPPSRSRVTRIAYAAVPAILIAGFVAWWMMPVRSVPSVGVEPAIGSDATKVPGNTANAEVPAPASAPIPVTSTPVEPPPPQPTRRTLGTASARAPAPSITTSASPPAKPPAPSHAVPAPTGPAKRPGCEQPSYIDEHGITRYKVECL